MIKRFAIGLVLILATAAIGLGLFIWSISSPVKITPPVVVKANPPPRPPNCPDFPELANLKLKDGSMADVRIIQDGDEKFYIPFNWYTARLKWHQVNGSQKIEDYLALFKGDWNPDISADECPGVLHVGKFNYSTPETPTYNITDKYRTVPNFSPESKFDKISFFQTGPNKTYKSSGGVLSDDDIRNYVFASVTIFSLGNGHWAECEHFPWDEAFKNGPAMNVGPIWEAYRARAMASEEYKNWRQSVHDVYEWLQTPPKDRDNERIFILGVKQP
ncbi:MAG: hypothetical protein ABI230_07905 [Aestuariivirga sp.]